MAAINSLVHGGDSYLLRSADIAVIAKPQQTTFGFNSLINWKPTASNADKYTLVNRSAYVPDVVAEGNQKPVKRGTNAQVTVDVLKLAEMLAFTDEEVADALLDPEAFMRDGVLAGFAQRLSSVGLGWDAGETYASSSTKSIRSVVTQSVDLDVTHADGLKRSIAAAKAVVRSKFYSPDGVCLATDLETVIENSRSSIDEVVVAYPNGTRDVAPGIQVVFDGNLHNAYTDGDLDTLDTAGSVVGVVGAWGAYGAKLRNALTSRPATGAVLGNTVEDVHFAGQYNEVFTVWEMRAGLGVIDPDAFCAIVIPSEG